MTRKESLRKLIAEIEKGRRSGETEGYFTLEEVIQELNKPETTCKEATP